MNVHETFIKKLCRVFIIRYKCSSISSLNDTHWFIYFISIGKKRKKNKEIFFISKIIRKKLISLPIIIWKENIIKTI